MCVINKMLNLPLIFQGSTIFANYFSTNLPTLRNLFIIIQLSLTKVTSGLKNFN